MKASIILVFLFWLQVGWAQTSSLNAYEYVIVPMQFDFQSEPNEYRLNILARVLLKDEGFEVYMDKEERPLDYRGNSCKPLFLEVENTSGFLNLSVVVRLKDCQDKILFESEEGTTKIKNYEDGYQAALRQAFESLSDANYRFDSSLKEADNRTTRSMSKVEKSSEMAENYPDKKIYKFGGETYWLVKKDNKDYSILANAGKESYAELENADKGTFIFNSRIINGAAFFDADGNLIVEYRDEDLDEVQNMTFRKID